MINLWKLFTNSFILSVFINTSCVTFKMLRCIILTYAVRPNKRGEKCFAPTDY